MTSQDTIRAQPEPADDSRNPITATFDRLARIGAAVRRAEEKRRAREAAQRENERDKPEGGA